MKTILHSIYCSIFIHRVINFQFLLIRENMLLHFLKLLNNPSFKTIDSLKTIDIFEERSKELVN